MSKRNRKTTKPEPQAEAIDQTEAVVAAAEEPELPPNRSVVPRQWVRAYAKSTLKGTCDDRIAHAMAKATQTDGKPDPAKIVALGEANGVDVLARWGKRNIGMQRMNLGNVLRGRAKRGEPVHGLEL